MKYMKFFLSLCKILTGHLSQRSMWFFLHIELGNEIQSQVVTRDACRDATHSHWLRHVTRTEPRDVLVVPCQRLFAACVQGSSARHPPESVNIRSSVKVSPPQQAHSSKALLSCKHRQRITWVDFHLIQSYIRFASHVPTSSHTFR